MDGGRVLNESRSAVIVDDDEDVRLILRAVLAASGFVVHEARTGLDGVELALARTEFDLLCPVVRSRPVAVQCDGHSAV